MQINNTLHACSRWVLKTHLPWSWCVCKRLQPNPKCQSHCSSFLFFYPVHTRQRKTYSRPWSMFARAAEAARRPLKMALVIQNDLENIWEMLNELVHQAKGVKHSLLIHNINNNTTAHRPFLGFVCAFNGQA